MSKNLRQSVEEELRRIGLDPNEPVASNTLEACLEYERDLNTMWKSMFPSTYQGLGMSETTTHNQQSTSQECNHVWKTYNSGWTQYEYCVKCDIKRG